MVKVPPSSSISLLPLPPSSSTFSLPPHPCLTLQSHTRQRQSSMSPLNVRIASPLIISYLSLTPLSFNSPTSRSPCRSRYRKHWSRKICPLSWSTYQLCHRRCTPSTCRLFRWKRHGRQIAHRQRCGCKRSEVCNSYFGLSHSLFSPTGMAALLAVFCIMPVTHSDFVSPSVFFCLPRHHFHFLPWTSLNGL